MLYSIVLTLGLYVLPSSVYWVIPVCIVGGLYLLLYHKYKRLIHLIISSVIAAVNTFILYALIWLAIGSNLLSKTEGGEWFGQGHVHIILSAPFRAMKTGIDYMLATPYIQSVEREGYFEAFAGWLQSLFDYFYSGAGIWLAVLVVMGCAAIVWTGYKAYRAGKNEQVFLAIYVVVMVVLTPLILIIQCKLPYFRVFSYMGTVIALVVVWLLQSVAEWMAKRVTEKKIPAKENENRKIDWFRGVPVVLCTFLAIVLLMSKDYNNQYGTAEYYALDALEHGSVEEKATLCVTDCFQQYLLKFRYDIECESTQIENADLVLIHKQMVDADYDGFRWEFYHTYESIPWEYVQEQMTQVYENEEYILYTKNKL